MPQFFLDEHLVPGREITIGGAEARHITRSLRLTKGDWIVLSDGSGRSFRATITGVSPQGVTAVLGSELPHREGAVPPALAIATIRPDRFEWAIEKAVELGCRHILPYHSARTVRGKGSSAGAAKVARWQKIAIEAAKQSGLPHRPRIEAPIAFAELCRRSPEFSPVILFFEGERDNGLRAVLSRHLAAKRATCEALLIVGPEGGFAAHEVDEAVAGGAVVASLGQQILRVETAAVTAVALLQYELGNLDTASS